LLQKRQDEAEEHCGLNKKNLNTNLSFLVDMKQDRKVIFTHKYENIDVH
jgi:hypothetical protein